jgi:hypothetical protein
MSNSIVFYATLGSGQPGAPGYFRIEVKHGDCAGDVDKAAVLARRRVHKATDGRWAFLYRNLCDMNERDRVFRGEA